MTVCDGLIVCELTKGSNQIARIIIIERKSFQPEIENELSCCAIAVIFICKVN